MKILIWGTGENTKKYLRRKEIEIKDIIGFIESNRTKLWFDNDLFENKIRIFSPTDIHSLEYDFILICVWPIEFIDEIADICIKLDILDQRIIFMRNIQGIQIEMQDFIYYNKYQDDKEIQKYFPIFWNEFMEHTKFNEWVLSVRNGDDSLRNSALYTQEFCGYTQDYFRYRTFELVAEEIKNRNVVGDVAEVGVARGTFSKLINYIFSDRMLYMFDTFDSFDRDEFNNDISLPVLKEEFYNLYRNIDIEEVIKIMPNKENCIIKKGLFPDTTIGLENNTYAFVSIDVDLEKSIYNSLEYFYPRLNCGGVIFVHDYICHDLEGVKRSIQRYEKEHGRLFKVPIADRGGTLIILK